MLIALIEISFPTHEPIWSLPHAGIVVPTGRDACVLVNEHGSRFHVVGIRSHCFLLLFHVGILFAAATAAATASLLTRGGGLVHFRLPWLRFRILNRSFHRAVPVCLLPADSELPPPPRRPPLRLLRRHRPARRGRPGCDSDSLRFVDAGLLSGFRSSVSVVTVSVPQKAKTQLC